MSRDRSALLKVKRDLALLEDARNAEVSPLYEAYIAKHEKYKRKIDALKVEEARLKGKLETHVMAKVITQVETLTKQKWGSLSAMEVDSALRLVDMPQDTHVRYRVARSYEIADADALPRDLMAPDKARVKAAWKSGEAIPGVIDTYSCVASVFVDGQGDHDADG